MTRFGPLNFPEVLHVARNMREWDAKEIYATRWTDDPAEVAADCMAAGKFSWLAYAGDTPVAVVGAWPAHPGVWSVFMFATDDFNAVAFSLTKFIKRVMIPALVKTGAHRAECHSIEGHEVAHRWLEFLGAKAEEPRKFYGRNRETFICYAWT